MLLLCFMAMIIDGYDVQIIGVAAAGIRETLKLEPATLGIISTAGQVGVTLGAALLAPFADRLGRKTLMVASCLIFGVFSFLTAFAASVQLHRSPAAMCCIAGAPLLLGCFVLLALRTQTHFRHRHDAALEAAPAVAQPSA